MHPATCAETWLEGPPVLVSNRRRRPDDQPDHAEVHGRTHACDCSYPRCRPRSPDYPTASRGRHHRRGRTQRSFVANIVRLIELYLSGLNFKHRWSRAGCADIAENLLLRADSAALGYRFPISSVEGSTAR